MTSARTLTVPRNGDSTVLEVRETPVPPPGPGEAQVEVLARVVAGPGRDVEDEAPSVRGLGRDGGDRGGVPGRPTADRCRRNGGEPCLQAG